MTALHLVLTDATADDLAALADGDLTPRLVTSAPLAIPRPVGSAPAIYAEWSPPGATYYTRTEQAADSPDARNAAWWRALLGPGSLRLTSHPAGMADAAGLKSRRVLGTWNHDDEAPDLVRFDAAPRFATLTVGGLTERAELVACPNGVPAYTVPQVSPMARILSAVDRVARGVSSAVEIGGVVITRATKAAHGLRNERSGR
jgi:hypothetical protein